MIQQQSLNVSEIESKAINFWYADKALLIVTLGWLILNLMDFQQIIQRPIELFTPNNWFGRVFCPTLPTYPIFLIIWSTAIASIAWLFFKNEDNILFRFLLAFTILWLNAVRWSYGFQSHVPHFFLLAHCLKIFFPVNIKKNIEAGKVFILTEKLFVAGLLVTYTWSSVWKIIGLFNKIFFHKGETHWLNANAAYLNAIVSNRSYDTPLDSWIFPFLAQGFTGQIGFIFFLMVQLGAIYAAFNSKIRFAWILLITLSHVLNILFFQIYFYITPILLLVLFFPYSRFLSSSSKLKPQQKSR
jgi:hypothetical protein